MNARQQALEQIAHQYHLNDEVPDKFIEDLCQEHCCHWLEGLVGEGDRVIELGYGEGITLGAVTHEGETHPEALVTMPLAMMNRHGLIAGATGTGKTRTLQLLAEQLSQNGVPVFAADIKGDLSGLAAAVGWILLVVYAAFSQGMNEGIWRTLTLDALLALTVVSTVLLGIVLAVTWFGSHWLGFNRADQIAITFSSLLVASMLNL